ncbi:MAG: DUF308 domain-containing protein [Candidatus Odinarchaeota archaeon]
MSEEIPMWLRALDVLVGIILVVLGIWVIWGIIDPSYLIGVTLMQLMGIILIIWGIWNLIKGFLAKEMAMAYRALLLIAAILLIIFGGLAFAHPFLVESVIALLFAIGLIIYGVITLIVSLMDKETKGWVRSLAIILGFFLLILGIIFIFFLQTAATVLYFFLAIALIIAGFVRIVYGLSGEYY